MRNHLRNRPRAARWAALTVVVAFVVALSACGGSDASKSSSASRKASGEGGYNVCFASNVAGGSVAVTRGYSGPETSALTSTTPVCADDQSGVDATLKVGSSNVWRIQMGRYLEDTIVVSSYDDRGNPGAENRITLEPVQNRDFYNWRPYTSEIAIERLPDSGDVQQFRITLR